MYSDIRLIGLGGIGSNLVPSLVRFLVHARKKKDPIFKLTLIDGDIIEDDNLKRQQFFKNEIGMHKAQAIGTAYAIPGVDIIWVTDYVDKTNVHHMIPNNCITILAVDNNKTRHLVQEHCLTLKNILLVNGGNDVYDGDVEAFRKEDGVVVMNPIWDDQPQIKDPKDEHPRDRSCEARYKSEPQLFTTNLAVATEIIKFLTPVILKKEILWSRKYFDVRAGSRVESKLTPAQLLKVTF